MRTQLPLLSLFVILTASIVTTGIRQNWFGTKNRWQQVGNDIDGEASGDWSGFEGTSGTSVSLSSDGNIVVIGAPYNDGNGNESGHVRIFQLTESTSTWKQMGADIDGEASGDRSGSSVSLSSNGNIVAIGTTGNDGNGSGSGHVRIFRWND